MCISDWSSYVCSSDLKSDYSAKALALTILCATLSNETFNATWSEIDLHGAVWTIPAKRMKAGKEHRIPLSDAAITLLRGVHRLEGNPFVFPGARKGQDRKSTRLNSSH